MSALLDSPRLTVPIGPEDHTSGPPTARVTLVEYGDYECPFCGMAAPVVEEIIDRLGDDLLFAYRHFPLLADFHPKGQVAQTYGVYNDGIGMSERALFVVDSEGTIHWSYVSPIGVNPGAEGILTALESLVAQGVSA